MIRNPNLAATRRRQEPTPSSVDYVRIDKLEEDRSSKYKVKKEAPPSVRAPHPNGLKDPNLEQPTGAEAPGFSSQPPADGAAGRGVANPRAHRRSLEEIDCPSLQGTTKERLQTVDKAAFVSSQLP